MSENMGLKIDLEKAQATADRLKATLEEIKALKADLGPDALTINITMSAGTNLPDDFTKEVEDMIRSGARRARRSFKL